MSAWMSNTLRVLIALVLLVAWSFGVIPQFNMPPLVTFLVSFPIGIGLTCFLALTWRES